MHSAQNTVTITECVMAQHLTSTAKGTQIDTMATTVTLTENVFPANPKEKPVSLTKSVSVGTCVFTNA